MIKYLIEHGADISKEDNFGWTPLHFACLYGNINLVKYLIDNGADINKMSILGETPLFYAFLSENENLVKYLIECKAYINVNINIRIIERAGFKYVNLLTIAASKK